MNPVLFHQKYFKELLKLDDTLSRAIKDALRENSVTNDALTKVECLELDRYELPDVEPDVYVYTKETVTVLGGKTIKTVEKRERHSEWPINLDEIDGPEILRSVFDPTPLKRKAKRNRK